MNKSFIVAVLTILLAGCHTSSDTSRTSFNPFYGVNSQNSDAAITNAVQTAFADHPLLNSLPIAVQTENKVVSLNGFVKTIRQSDIAEEEAKKIQGVQAVQNNLIVRK